MSVASADDLFVNTDYTNIADMLDGPMDWSAWDEQIMGSRTGQQPEQELDFANMPSGLSETDMNGLLSAVQPASAPVMPGNILYPQGTRPLDRGDMYDVSFNWQDLQDVDLDIRDYNTGGLWGQTPSWSNKT